MCSDVEFANGNTATAGFGLSVRHWFITSDERNLLSVSLSARFMSSLSRLVESAARSTLGSSEPRTTSLPQAGWSARRQKPAANEAFRRKAMALTYRRSTGKARRVFTRLVVV
jgi:hypothetical protein